MKHEIDIETRNLIFQNLSNRVANRNWKLVDKMNSSESRELFCVPTPIKVESTLVAVEHFWTR